MKTGVQIREENERMREALTEVREFLNHIQPKVGHYAFMEISDIVDHALGIDDGETF